MVFFSITDNETVPSTSTLEITFHGWKESVKFIHSEYAKVTDIPTAVGYVVNAAVQYAKSGGSLLDYVKDIRCEDYTEEGSIPLWVVNEWELAKQAHDALEKLFGQDEDVLNLVYWIAQEI